MKLFILVIFGFIMYGIEHDTTTIDITDNYQVAVDTNLPMELLTKVEYIGLFPDAKYVFPYGWRPVIKSFFWARIGRKIYFSKRKAIDAAEKESKAQMERP